MADRHATAIFDGDCGFCRQMADRVRGRDHHQLIEFLPLQSDEVARRFPSLTREACERELHLVAAGGRVFRGARAIAEIWRRLGFGWKILGAISAHPPVIWPAILVYRWVARNRHRLGPKSCPVPTDV